MVRAKIAQKKPAKKKIAEKKQLNLFKKILNRLIGKELAIGITIWFVLMSFLMLFANNLRVQTDLNEIHAAASEISDTVPWIWQ